MITVDIKSLLKRLNKLCKTCLETSAGVTVTRTHYEITVEHVFQQILEQPQSDIVLILKHFNISLEQLKSVINKTLEEFDTGNGAKPVFSPRLIEWFQEAHLTGTVELNENLIRSGSLLLAFLSRPLRLSPSGISDLLKPIIREELVQNFNKILENSAEQPAIPKQTQTGQSDPDSALIKFCEDFTKKASEGKIDPVFGRDNEIRQMIDILARRRKNNPIIVGEAGVGKTAVVEGLALRIVEEDVPDFLKNVTLMTLDMGLLQAGAGMKGEFENRLKRVIAEVKGSEKPIILFIDEAHTVVGAGNASGGGDAANLLKPALARGELRTIAATTWSEYKKYFEKDAALARRFQPVHLDEPSEETTTLILRGLKDKYEENHNVVIRDDAIVAASELSSRYISGRYLPDKAIDLIDTSAARVKVMLSAKPDIMEDTERKLQAVKREKQGIERDQLHGAQVDKNRLEEINIELEKLEKEIEQITDKWQKEQELTLKLIDLRTKLESNQPEPEIEEQIEHTKAELAKLQKDGQLVCTEVDPEIVSKVVSDWTGIPVGKVMHDQAQSIIDLEKNLKVRIKGQDQGLSKITRIIKASKAGLTEPCQPSGVFLLVGPSGVGKTETGLAMAELLFGGERFVVSVNMSEFQEKHTVSRLIGSPPGYIGYGEGGVLTEAIRQRPYSVVLLDEAEKANNEVMNLFYQVFDKGILSDGEGREIDFKNTVIFLTSNLGSDVITQLCSNQETISHETILSAIRPILSQHFKPALLARMNIVPYITLDSEIMKQIVEIKLNRLVDRLKTVHKINLKYTDKVTGQISDRCLEVETGARNIDHIMSHRILPEISEKILTLMSQENIGGSEGCLDVADDGTFSIDF